MKTKKETENEMAAIRGWDADEERAEILKIYAVERGYILDRTGDCCAGDEVIFARPVFTGSRKRARFAGIEIIQGEIVKDSYGKAKQQHTFTIETEGKKMCIKGRNLYGIGAFAKPRAEQERSQVLDDKHQRGNAAREDRAQRLVASLDF